MKKPGEGYSAFFGLGALAAFGGAAFGILAETAYGFELALTCAILFTLCLIGGLLFDTAKHLADALSEIATDVQSLRALLVASSTDATDDTAPAALRVDVLSTPATRAKPTPPEIPVNSHRA